MPFDWYTGSDTTLQVPRTISRPEERDDLSSEERIEAYKALLDVEKEPNWRGSIEASIAREWLGLEREEEYAASLVRAIGEFDPPRSSLLSVVEDYGWALYSLLRDVHRPAVQPEAAVKIGFALLSVMDLADLDRFRRAMALTFLSQALRWLAEDRADALLFSIALPLAIRAHHMQPDDEFILELLTYLYFHLGEHHQCVRLFGELKEISPAGEPTSRVGDFLRQTGIQADRGSSLPS